jgi:hypothetical protein
MVPMLEDKVLVAIGRTLDGAFDVAEKMLGAQRRVATGWFQSRRPTADSQAAASRQTEDTGPAAANGQAAADGQAAVKVKATPTKRAPRPKPAAVSTPSVSASRVRKSTGRIRPRTGD